MLKEKLPLKLQKILDKINLGRPEVEEVLEYLTDDTNEPFLQMSEDEFKKELAKTKDKKKLACKDDPDCEEDETSYYVGFIESGNSSNVVGDGNDYSFRYEISDFYHTSNEYPQGAEQLPPDNSEVPDIAPNPAPDLSPNPLPPITPPAVPNPAPVPPVTPPPITPPATPPINPTPPDNGNTPTPPNTNPTPTPPGNNPPPVNPPDVTPPPPVPLPKVHAPTYMIQPFITGFEKPNGPQSLEGVDGVPPFTSYENFMRDYKDKTISTYEFLSKLKDGTLDKNKSYWIRHGLPVDEAWQEAMKEQNIDFLSPKYGTYKLNNEDWDLIMKNLNIIDGVSTSFSAAGDSGWVNDPFVIPKERVTPQLMDKFYNMTVKITGIENTPEDKALLRQYKEKISTFSANETIELTVDEFKEIVKPFKGNYANPLSGYSDGSKIKITDLTGDLSYIISSKGIVGFEMKPGEKPNIGFNDFKELVQKGELAENSAIIVEDERSYPEESNQAARVYDKRGMLFDLEGIFENFGFVYENRQFLGGKIRGLAGHHVHLKEKYSLSDGSEIYIKDHLDMFEEGSVYLMDIPTDFDIEVLKNNKIAVFDVLDNGAINVSKEDALILFNKATEKSLNIQGELTVDDRALIFSGTISSANIQDGAIFDDVKQKEYNQIVKNSGILGDYKVNLVDTSENLKITSGNIEKINTIDAIGENGRIKVNPDIYEALSNKLADQTDSVVIEIKDVSDDLEFNLKSGVKDIIGIREDNNAKTIIRGFDPSEDKIDIKTHMFFQKNRDFVTDMTEDGNVEIETNKVYHIKISENIANWDLGNENDSLNFNKIFNNTFFSNKDKGNMASIIISGNDGSHVLKYWGNYDNVLTHEDFTSIIYIDGLTDINDDIIDMNNLDKGRDDGRPIPKPLPMPMPIPKPIGGGEEGSDTPNLGSGIEPIPMPDPLNGNSPDPLMFPYP